jgi:hypothetical protein
VYPFSLAYLSVGLAGGLEKRGFKKGDFSGPPIITKYLTYIDM